MKSTYKLPGELLLEQGASRATLKLYALLVNLSRKTGHCIANSESFRLPRTLFLPPRLGVSAGVPRLVAAPPRYDYSNPVLAEALELSERTISRGLVWLKKHAWIDEGWVKTSDGWRQRHLQIIGVSGSNGGAQ